MVTIAIVGANGQVGQEVCLFLSLRKDVTVVPISRTTYGTALLTRLGLSCRVGSVEDPSRAKDLLSGCDLVADFALPRGLCADVRRVTHTLIMNCVTNAPAGACYVYASTLMAFGTGPSEKEFRWRRIPRTLYASNKRYGERLALGFARKNRRDAFILRLGEVHGELQRVSKGVESQMRPQTAYIPDCPGYSVFCYTIAEALVNIALGKETPGAYSLVSSPEWTWEEMYRYLAARVGIDPEIVLVNEASAAGSMLQRIASCSRFAGAPVAAALRRNRELLGSVFFRFFPGSETTLRAKWLTRQASAQIAEGRRSTQYWPFAPMWGTPPGRRLASLSDSRRTMGPAVAQVRQSLAKLSRSLDDR
jgi:nucleoside-diphosphate-sugar epimerase